ncbi:MAG: pseudouridine synthase [Pseudomonadales bacterium]|nr:pseudouridine synthase [Pseudomonadales bacterium]
MSCLVLFNKPFNVLCQFTDNAGRATLADFIKMKNVYAAGRLDRDSEGLLLLTDDGSLQQEISNPRHKLRKTYWVQVEGLITEDALRQLRQGIQLKDGLTLPAQARAIPAPSVWERQPAIRERRNIPVSWLELSIREGRNRQVRRMTAATGFPTLRLIRQRIGAWSVAGLLPGESRVITL